MLNEALTSIKGIGPGRAERFASLGLFSILDLIHFFPRDYHDFSKATNISELNEEEYVAVRILFIGKPKTIRTSSGLRITTVSIGDATGNLQAIWFNQPYVATSIPLEPHGYALGRVDKRHGTKLLAPFFIDTLPGIQPIYPLKRGLNQNMIRNAVRTALVCGLDEIEDDLGDSLCYEFNLIDIHSALSSIHFPSDPVSLEKAKHRLAFESALKFTLMLELARFERSNSKGIAFDIDSSIEEFVSMLPFKPTEAQLKVMHEVSHDMSSPSSMNRLVQGDVGSGKTIIALYAMFVALKNGCQSVLMVPTEILAEQHFKLLKQFFGNKAALITGSISAVKRRELLCDIQNGRIMAITGTHALIENKVEFQNLGLVITDEQHRFGVSQRARLSKKAHNPDVMIMSATPIPRTLSLLLYGDLDVSLVDGMPPGRKPVTTRLVPQNKRIAMYRYIEKEIQTRRIQAYVVCPMIEDNESLAEVNSAENVFNELSDNLAIKAALIHGRMRPSEKDVIMSDFRDGKIDLLVSTTVIEVGVDVPNARIIVIESAERFGLAQLHQLRGRVGRSSGESFCFLISGSDSKASKERLKTLIATNDGFKIAEKDLELRGPGDFLGTRQSGLAGLGAPFISTYMTTLVEARNAAKKLITLKNDDSIRLQSIVREAYADLFENIVIN